MGAYLKWIKIGTCMHLSLVPLPMQPLKLAVLAELFFDGGMRLQVSLCLGSLPGTGVHVKVQILLLNQQAWFFSA